MSNSANSMPDVGNDLATESMVQLPAMIAFWDQELVCRFANQAYSEWFGKSKEEMIDKMTLDALLGPEIYALNEPYISAALSGKSQYFERALPTPIGLRYTLASYIPQYSNGMVNGFFAHTSDVTQLKKLQKELTETNDKLKVQNKRLLNFANIITHNLKSYANNLSVTLKFMDGAVSESEKAETQALLKEISSGFTSTISHLSEIVDVENIKVAKNEAINLRNCVDEAIKPLRVQIMDNNAIVHNNISQTISIWANHPYLDSIVLNLLSNALKYRDENRDPVIEIDAIENEREVALTIRDNGIGIDLDKNRDSLFGLYKTFHGNSDAKGIGLYLVKSQIEAMGGRIEVESQLSVGSVFKVYFQKRQ